MSYDFPSSPSIGQTFGNYIWNGAGWQMYGASPQIATAETRNRITNGAMQISQENGDTSGGASWYPADQWIMQTNLVASVTRFPTSSVISPNGSHVIRTSINTAKPSLAAADYWFFRQLIEGIRLRDFLWGTANAKQAILRFWAIGAAGTYAASLRNSALNRSFIAPFTLPATTWTEIKIVIPGDTTGTWTSDTGIGAYLDFTWASGSNSHGVAGWQAGSFSNLSTSTNGAATVNNSFSLADVGMYLDPDLTGMPPKWTMPDEAEELRACQRYWERWEGASMQGYHVAGSYASVPLPFKVNKRIVPAMAIVGWDTATNTLNVQTNNPKVWGAGLTTGAAATGTYIFLGVYGNANARM